MDKLFKVRYAMDRTIMALMTIDNPDLEDTFKLVRNNPEKLHETIKLIYSYNESLQNVKKYYTKELEKIVES